MLIKVTPHIVKIIREQSDPINEKEINVSRCQFEFSEEIEDDYVKEAYFTLNGNTYKQIIVNNECDYPSEVLEQKGELEIGVVVFKVENEEYVKLYNPTPDYYETWIGSLKDAENTEPITPSDKEQIEQQLTNISNQMDNLDIEASKVEHTTTITITRKDGTSYDVEVLDGEKGDKGDKGDAGAIQMQIVSELPQTGSEDIMYLVPLEEPESQENKYAEYVYINNQWELLGKIGVQVDLTDYVKNTDYASASKGGVIKATGDYSFRVSNEGKPNANVLSYSDYSAYSNNNFISKGTLENVITGKGLVSNTDYATSSVGGVIKSRSTHGFNVADGQPYASTYDYTTYQGKANSTFISKGTLENVLTARIGDIQTLLDNLDVGNGVS